MPLIRRDAAAPPARSPPAADPFAGLLASFAGERWAAARAIGGDPSAVAALEQALLREPDDRVREAIFAALARADTNESAQAVLPCLRSDDANLRTGAVDALRAMPTAAMMVLPDLLADPDADVRLLSCEIARNLPPARATTLLCGLIDQEAEVNVCAAAIDVLAEVGDASALPSLDRCAERFGHEPFLSFAIKATRKRLADGPAERG